jgi:YggT family protein
VSTVLFVISVLLTLYWLILLGRIILDLVRSLTGGRGLSGLAVPYGILYDLTEPVLRPIRRLLPPLRVGAVALDLSPILVFMLIVLLQRVVSS